VPPSFYGGEDLKFTCERYTSLLVMHGKKSVRFENGELETEDKELIEVLRKSPNVTEVKEPKKKGAK
jgi:hypothetical protein